MKTGVYCITNKINGKRYVGSTSFSFYYRFKHHINALNRGDHCNDHLQKAWNKYGQSAFDFSILEGVEPLKCVEREQWFLDNTRCDYNLCKKAGSVLGIKRSADTKLKLSLSKRGNKNPSFGKISKSAKRVILTSITSGERREFQSCKLCAEYLGMKQGRVYMILGGYNPDKPIQKMGYTIKYKE